MSRLFIKDLERIKNGNLVRFNENTKEKHSSLISLAKLQSELSELRNIRSIILKQFRNDMNTTLDYKKGCKISSDYKVSFSSNELFLDDYLSLFIPTLFGDSICLFDKNTLVSSTSSDNELYEKIEVILPYIKKIFNVKENSNVLNNEFYKDYGVFDNFNTKVFNINGNGIIIPFYDYTDFPNKFIQELLTYYSQNSNDILKNILIPNTESLDNYRLNTNKEKVLKLYKGEK